MMVRKGIKCKFGRLSSPVVDADGSRRVCKLKKKSSAGISQDRKKSSKEAHEVRYRAKRRLSKKR